MPQPYPQATTPSTCGYSAEKGKRRRHWGWVPITGEDSDFGAPEAARAIGIFMIQMIVIHIRQDAIPVDDAFVPVTLVQVVVGQQDSTISTGPKDTKPIKRISE